MSLGSVSSSSSSMHVRRSEAGDVVNTHWRYCTRFGSTSNQFPGHNQLAPVLTAAPDFATVSKLAKLSLNPGSNEAKLLGIHCNYPWSDASAWAFTFVRTTSDKKTEALLKTQNPLAKPPAQRV